MNATMNLMKFLLVITLVAGAMALSSHPAAADHIEDEAAEQYRDAMWVLVPELGDWADDLYDTVDAVDLKPEMAAQLPELAHRGEYMVYDLEGTPPPADLVDAHEDLLFALRQMTEAAQIAVDDSAGAHYLIEREMERFERARREIRGWLMADVEIVGSGATPAVLVAGN